ncbi:hypothetical protein K503DRAFT_734196 [Rhizopogon vinicolor AM-OR11-026]|uniref:Uncharacterized protein n=1 Tax=Rhizopogon vinicolor AM-OR11-026 TaxID=1314800 RepID=A0A1B7NBG2_9AGAM|nr:hypothetical protein K503DRAFT_734196 [Rhizopogon vinicolor AM-OR11-026]
MPTATATTVLMKTAMVDILPQKLPTSPPIASKISSSTASTEVTLQSLYNRAARAFLHRDVAVTFTLLNTAFVLLPPPIAPSPDALDAHRRKWDILRITLETTVFSSPPDITTLPQPLRETLLLSPQSFISTSYARSLALFTPSSLPRKPSSAFLPHQVLITLVASCLKLDCPNIGREMVEDWLSKRGQYEFVPSIGEAYDKVIELYCLHVLPRLGEWEYVGEFLSYENELSSDRRRELLLALEAQRGREQEKREIQKPETPQAFLAPISPPRSPSPASSSSSLSTISTRTAVPSSRTESSPRPKLTRRQSASSTSAVSDTTITRASPRHRPNHDQNTPRGSPSTSRVRSSRIPRALPTDNQSLATTQPPSSSALIRSYFSHYFTPGRIATLSVLFFLIPVLSLIIRRRRRSQMPVVSTADQVRRRLLEARGDSILRQLWGEMVRAILDTVRMGGGGLV